MIFYLNTALILMIISGFACLTAGLIFMIRGYISKNRKNKVGRGWTLSILGTLIVVFFVIGLSRILQEEGEGGSGFIFASWLLLFLFFPLAILFVLIVTVFFLVIGVNSLKEGFARNSENKRDVVSIVLGFVMLVLLVLVLASLAMFAGVTFGAFGKSLKKAYNNSTSYPISESAKILKYYLFSIMYK